MEGGGAIVSFDIRFRTLIIVPTARPSVFKIFAPRKYQEPRDALSKYAGLEGRKVTEKKRVFKFPIKTDVERDRCL